MSYNKIDAQHELIIELNQDLVDLGADLIDTNAVLTQVRGEYDELVDMYEHQNAELFKMAHRKDEARMHQGQALKAIMLNDLPGASKHIQKAQDWLNGKKD